ncbi:MAG: response regulator [bacterium]|nr:response regulator [bacterium]
MHTLIVEDSRMNVEVLQKYICPFGECDAVVNGKLAVEFVHKSLQEGKPYNLICMDIMMPEMDGQTALVEIRKSEEEAGIPNSKRAKIIMISAADVKENMFKAFKGQCDAYITKPIKKKDLLKHLHDLELVDSEAMLEMLLK